MISYPHGHIGRKIEKIRKIKEIKQDTLAKALGITRQGYARMEQSENIDSEKLKVIADTLGVTAEAIRNFNEDAVINNNIYDQNNTVINYNLNAAEKVVELYEKLLQSEKEKVTMLEKMVELLSSKISA